MCDIDANHLLCGVDLVVDCARTYTAYNKYLGGKPIAIPTPQLFLAGQPCIFSDIASRRTSSPAVFLVVHLLQRRSRR